MEDILGQVLKGVIEKQTGSRGGTQSDPVADLIGGILGGGQSQRRQQQPATPDIGDLIGGILGGGQAPRRQQQQPNQPDITDIIGSIIGNSQRRDTGGRGGVSDLIGAIMGGGQGQQVNPIAQIIANKFGIPPAIAQMAVAYFTAKMLSKNAPRQAQDDGYGIGRADRDSMDLDDLFEVMDDDEELDNRFEGSGMAEELAEKIGLDQGKAGGILKEIMKAVGKSRQQVEPVQPSGNGLEDLLDNW